MKLELIRPTKEGKFKCINDDRAYIDLCLGNGTMFRVGMMRVGGVLFIGVEGKGAYTFSQFAHVSYVMEKLKMYEGDAANVADFINDQIHGEEQVDRQGFYDLNCCIK